MLPLVWYEIPGSAIVAQKCPYKQSWHERRASAPLGLKSLLQVSNQVNSTLLAWTNVWLYLKSGLQLWPNLVCTTQHPCELSASVTLKAGCNQLGWLHRGQFVRPRQPKAGAGEVIAQSSSEATWLPWLTWLSVIRGLNWLLNSVNTFLYIYLAKRLFVNEVIVLHPHIICQSLLHWSCEKHQNLSWRWNSALSLFPMQDWCPVKSLRRCSMRLSVFII